MDLADMTFQEFQTVCSGVITTGTSASAPCPISIGDDAAKVISWYGQGVKALVVLKEQVPQAPMLAILNSCRFSFDEPNNLTVISPITTGHD
jgi:hypothetical protein